MIRSLAALLGLALLFSVAGPAEVAWAGFGVANARTDTPNTPQTSTIRETDAPDGDAPPDAQPDPAEAQDLSQGDSSAVTDDQDTAVEPSSDDPEDPGEPQ